MSYIELFLNSQIATRSGGLDTSPFPNLNNPLFTIGRQLQNVQTIKIMEVEIPNSFYVISDALGPIMPAHFGPPPDPATNNYTQHQNSIVFITQGTKRTLTATIPPGTYSGPGLALVIQNSLALGDYTFLGALTPSSPPSVNFNQNNGSFTFTFSSTTNIQQLYMQTSANTTVQPMNITIGFPQNITHGIYASNAYTFQGNFALTSGPLELYICSNQLANTMRAYLPFGPLGTSGQSNPQICQLPNNANFGQLITWQDPVIFS